MEYIKKILIEGLFAIGGVSSMVGCIMLLIVYIDTFNDDGAGTSMVFPAIILLVIGLPIFGLGIYFSSE